MYWILPRYSRRRKLASVVKELLHRPSALPTRLTLANFQRYAQFFGKSIECNVCGGQAHVTFDFPDEALRREHGIGLLRETLNCCHCGASMRDRTLAEGVLRAIHRLTGARRGSIAEVKATGLGGLRILDTDAFGSLSRQLRSVAGYCRSSFLPDKPFDAEIEPSYFNLNLEHIGLPDEAFDIVLTSDVMEHVRQYQAAQAEIVRILKEGGCYVFTLPYDKQREQHRILVDVRPEGDVFLEEPHYHGDPLTGQILAYRIFGRRIFADFAALGLELQFEELELPAALVSAGDLFVGTKSAVRRETDQSSPSTLGH